MSLIGMKGSDMKCTCGHDESEHAQVGEFRRDPTYTGCYVKIKNGSNNDFCECQHFKPVEGARLV